jgi:hypothetical protein
MLLPWHGRGAAPCVRLAMHPHVLASAGRATRRQNLQNARGLSCDTGIRTEVLLDFGTLWPLPVALVQASKARIPFPCHPIEVATVRVPPHGLPPHGVAATSRAASRHASSSAPLSPRAHCIGETTVGPVRADARKGSCAGLCVHYGKSHASSRGRVSPPPLAAAGASRGVRGPRGLPPSPVDRGRGVRVAGSLPHRLSQSAARWTHLFVEV